MSRPTRIEARGLELVSPVWPWGPYVAGPEGVKELRVTSPFGPRTHPVTGEPRRFHNGVDLGLPQGTQLRPVAVGTVERLWWDHDLNGHAIRLAHGTWWSSYVHLSQIDVQVGQQVTPSEVIGLSGGAEGTEGAGRSTGPHLHLGVWEKDVNGKARCIDPVPVIDWRPLILTGAV